LVQETEGRESMTLLSDTFESDDDDALRAMGYGRAKT
jgi:hypothetical protein